MLGVKNTDSAIGSYNSNHTYDKPLFSSLESKSNFGRRTRFSKEQTNKGCLGIGFEFKSN